MMSLVHVRSSDVVFTHTFSRGITDRLKKSCDLFQPFLLSSLLLIEYLEQATDILIVMVRKASQGDERARAMLYQQFSQQMFSICVRMTGHYDDAKDLLHDSFILAFNRLDQLRDGHLFGSWLRKIVVNECIKHGKKGFVWQALDEEIMGTQDDDDVDWLREIDFSRIHEEIKNLPAGCRQIFNLYVLEDFTHQEISDIMNISISTSKSQYQRAKQLLKERLLKHFVTHGSI